MAGKPLSDELCDEALRALDTYGNKAAAARALGVPYTTFQSRISSALARPEAFSGEPRREIERDEDGDSLALRSLHDNVRSVDDLLAHAKVDLEVWKVDRHVVNTYEQGSRAPGGGVTVQPLWQVKAWLSRRAPMDLERVKAQAIEAMARHAPKYPRIAAPKKSARVLAEVSLPDLHLGKLAWGPESGDNYDIGIAQEVFRGALDDLVGRCARAHAVERFVFPFGNDFLNADNANSTTTAGTPQDMDGRWPKLFDLGRALLVEAAEKMAAIAPVSMVSVPGNHDRQSVHYLAVCLDAWFRNCDRVEVDAGPTLRKYVRHGSVLLGYTHGNEERHDSLPTIMANERPDFGECRFKEWHVGHLHKRREVKHTAGDTHGGVEVRTKPSLCGTDAWHFAKGYVGGVKAAEADLYDREHGRVATLIHHPAEGVYAA